MASKDTFTAVVPKEDVEPETYTKWANKIDGTKLTKVEAAIEKIENQGLVTNAKSLGDGLYEKKWNSGDRLYFTIIEDDEENKTLLVLGSGKGKEQDKAIAKCFKEMKNDKISKTNIRYKNEK
ncbi:MAG: hypothetical protein H6622_02335 [Halobacteriovoraceae bacterium]|nr:hypothetical protein [Halobacteriovoraceae bacterium]